MIRRLLALYPRAWRERYAVEVEDLVEAVGLSPGTALDLVVNAMHERVRPATRRTAGGPSMTIDRPGPGSVALAILGFIVLVPTLMFMSFSILIYNIGMPVDRIRSVIEVAVGIVPVDVGLAVLPFVAFALASAPLLRLSLARDGERRELIARIGLRSLRVRRANVVVSALAAIVISILVVYQVTEHLLS
jgi:hypothetical protein